MPRIVESLPGQAVLHYDRPNSRFLGLTLSVVLHATFLAELVAIKEAPQSKVKPPQIIEVATIALTPEPAPKTSKFPIQSQAPTQPLAESKPVSALTVSEQKKAEKPKRRAKPASPSGPKTSKEPPSAGSRAAASEPADSQAAVASVPSPPPSGTGQQTTSASHAGAIAEADYRSPALKNPPTIYPQAALQRGLEGIVKLRVQVLANGLPGEIRIEKSSGYAVLDEAAVKQLRMWHFIPARRGNRSVDSWVIVPIRFTIKH